MSDAPVLGGKNRPKILTNNEPLLGGDRVLIPAFSLRFGRQTCHIRWIEFNRHDKKLDLMHHKLKSGDKIRCSIDALNVTFKRGDIFILKWRLLD